MITQSQVDAVWKRQDINASRAEISRILAAFEALNTQATKVPPEVGSDQVVFVFDNYNGNDNSYSSLEEAKASIAETASDRSWDTCDIDSNIRVFIGRELNIEAEQAFTITFS